MVVEGDADKHTLEFTSGACRSTLVATIEGPCTVGINTIKTVLLLGLLSALLIFGGQALGGRNGIYIGPLLRRRDELCRIFLLRQDRAGDYSAQPVTETENPEVYRRVAPIVRNLTQRMGLPMPRLWVIAEDSPNAFATGRNPAHASVAFTTGILQIMDDREIEGVVAHELGHVLHRDILISSVAATIAAAITALAPWLSWFSAACAASDDDDGGSAWAGILMLFLAPIAAMLIQMAISRTREFDADEASAKYTGTPYNLISALQKLETYSKRIPMEASTGHAAPIHHPAVYRTIR